MAGSKEKVKSEVGESSSLSFESDNDTNDDLTREILSKLVKSKRIPTHVVAALSPYLTPG